MPKRSDADVEGEITFVANVMSIMSVLCGDDNEMDRGIRIDLALPYGWKNLSKHQLEVCFKSVQSDIASKRVSFAHNVGRIT